RPGVAFPSPLSPLTLLSRLQELAPFRKAGAKVEAFSLSARGRNKFFEDFLMAARTSWKSAGNDAKLLDLIGQNRIFRAEYGGFRPSKSADDGAFSENIEQNRNEVTQKLMPDCLSLSHH
ncbi:MAG: hypothetical protein J6U04_02610, partial [Salinivirgaceae bacterium]|nr:hypothetical protein [Salinivirgaceae bacterium]